MVVATEVALKQPRPQLRRESKSVVANRQRNTLVLRLHEVNFNCASIRAIADRVVDEIRQNLLEPDDVNPRHRSMRFAQFERVTAGARLRGVDRAFDERSDVDPFAINGQASEVK